MGGSDGCRLPTAAEPPSGVRRVKSEEDARALAYRLLMPGRRWPTVVLTIAGGHDEPFGDPEEIKEAVGDLAEVVLMPTSDVSWAFSRVMPAMTQVYGGAGRVYPVDHEWVANPSRSRLRFAYSPQDRRRITELLINDALQAALAGGALALRTTPGLRRRSGRVAGVIGSRAVVTLDDGTQATVWEELTVPGVALDRVLVKEQPVVGSYDPASRRLDLRGDLLYADAARARAAALDAYRVGDVLLADVADVTDDAVDLRLVPGFTVSVDRTAVTSNPKDTLRDLFTLGEVVLCRVVAAEPFSLRLDVDDDEQPVPAPSLLPGGPPWLDAPQRDPQAPVPPSDPASEPPREPPPGPPFVPPPGLAPNRATEPTKPRRRPSPLDIARRGPAAAMAAERATRDALSDELGRLRARAGDLEAELERAYRSIEVRQTRYRKAELARQSATRELRALKSRLEQESGIPGPAFLDPEKQFRYEVHCEWAQRIPAAEKADKPLAPYTLLPGFLDSVEQVEGVSRSKIVAVVVEVLTGQAPRLPGRDAHQLRDGGAGSPYVNRGDGATCWRVALQQDTPAARRLHYWRKAEAYELSRVALHDDFRP